MAAAAVAAAVGAFLLVSRPSQAPLRAAIVDQLSLTFPNPAFAEEAREILEEAGYTVDYYPGEEVTVEFYRGLAARGYGLVVLRVHSARLQGAWQSGPVDEVELFSSELYDPSRYAEERADGRLARVLYYEGSERYFGIAPSFIESSMRGRFDDATVIMMGCEGLASDATARAFVRKGAAAVIAWDGFVSAKYTDAATERVLRHLVVDEHSAAEAVARTMAEVGPDPEYGSTLRLYPAEEAAFVVP